MNPTIKTGTIVNRKPRPIHNNPLGTEDGLEEMSSGVDSQSRQIDHYTELPHHQVCALGGISR